MKYLYYSLVLLGISFSWGCQKESNGYLDQLDHVPATTYNATDPFNASERFVYGVWEAKSWSGTLAGVTVPIENEFLLIKPNGIYGYLRHDSLTVIGSVALLTDTDDAALSITFMPDSTFAVPAPLPYAFGGTYRLTWDDNRMFLWDYFADGITTTYERYGE